MAKNKRRTQKNGRERGNPGNGDGAFQNVMPVTHGQVHKGKREIRDRIDQREKNRGWE